MAMSLVALALSHFVEPWRRAHKREIIAKARADLVRFAVQSGTFQQIERRPVRSDRPTSSLLANIGGIFIADLRKPDTDLVYYAKRGAIQQLAGNDVLALADGEVQRQQHPDRRSLGDQLQHLCARLQPVQTRPRTGPTTRPKELSTAFLLFGPRTDRVLRGDAAGGRARRNLPALLGLALSAGLRHDRHLLRRGARSNRQERLWSLSAGIALALAVRGLGFFLINVSGTAPAWALLNFAMPVASILFFFTLIAMNKSLRFSAAWIDWSIALGNALMNSSAAYARATPPSRAGGAGR